MENTINTGFKTEKKKKLKNMLLFWYIVLSLVPLLIFSLIWIIDTNIILGQHIRDRLNLISYYRTEALISFFQTAAGDLLYLSEEKSLNNLIRLLKNKTDTQLITDPDTGEFNLLKDYQNNHKYDDTYLIDNTGRICYSIRQKSKIGVNINDPELIDTKFSKTCWQSLRTGELLYTDLELSQSSWGRPASFLVKAIPGDNGNNAGLVALQIPVSQINSIIAGNNNEVTMETYLIGMDGLMRSDSRFIAESTILNVRVNTRGANRVIEWAHSSGKSPVIFNSKDDILVPYSNYRGIQVYGIQQLVQLYGINLGILTEIDETEALQPIRNILLVILITVLVTIIVVVTVTMVVVKRINTPIILLTDWINRITAGDLSFRELEIPKNEIGDIYKNLKSLMESSREFAEVCQAIAVGECSKKVVVRSEKDIMGIAINRITDNYRNVINQAKKVAAGDYSSKFKALSDNDELGNALYNMISSLRYLHTKNNNENWLKTGINELIKRIQGNQKIDVLCDKIIRFICMYLNIKAGVLYINNNNQFELMSSYALSNLESRQKVFKLNEGLIGQVAKEKRTQIISDFPDNYMDIKSGLIDILPDHIVLIPLLYESATVGVMELGLVNELNELQLTFLKQVASNIAINISLTILYDKLHTSLDKTESQKLQLQNQSEELRVSNEELEEQTIRLQESEKKLQQQQEELRQTNEELEEHAKILKKQKEQLQRKTLEIAETAAELQRISKYKSEFLANMSHELRTPLNSMLILAKLLSENKQGNLSRKQIEFATTIFSSGNDLLILINEILDLAKIEAQKITLNIEKVNIKEMVNSLVDIFKPVARTNKLNLEYHIHKDIPAYIVTDEQRVMQILKNLFSNAFKFTTRGGVKLNIFFPKREAYRLKNHFDPATTLAFEIVDTGIGIPREKQKLIFEAFQQVDSGISRKFGGTGLGLSICRELVRILKGDIQLTSEEGQGSKFTVFLPLVIDEAQTGTDRKNAKKKTAEAAALEPVTEFKVTPNIADDRDDVTEKDNVVLIVEDDIKFAEVLLNLTREHGFKGIIALRGDIVIEMVQKYEPTGILLDISLPGIDGWSVLDRLKDDLKTRHIPVHIISGADKELQGLHMGAVGFLKKPVTLEQLNTVFDRIEQIACSKMRKLLVIEDNKDQLEAVKNLLAGNDLEIITANTGKKAYNILLSERFDCIVLDLTLPDMSGFDLLKSIRHNEEIFHIPVIIYTGKVLTDNERYELKEYADSIIIKDANCLELLLDQTALFLHRVEKNLSEQKKQMIEKLHNREEIFHAKKVLIVDDDMRNVFAMSAILEENNLTVEIAKNGKECIEYLEKNKDVDLILMDIMMPVMDGYETTEYVRKMNRYRNIPIIALTAKAMRGDKEKCIQSGASDYLSKPVNNDQLLSLLRVWLYKGY